VCSRASGTGIWRQRREGREWRVHSRAVHVAVGYEADGVWGGVERPDAVGLKSFAELHGIEAGGFAVEDDDVGFYNRGSMRRPEICAISRARNWALAWSSWRRLGDSSRAIRPAAARTPAWRMPPPRTFCGRCGILSMKAREPTIMEPTGAPSPLERQKHDGVEIAGHVRDGFTESDRGVEDARAVEMNFSGWRRARWRKFRQLDCGIERTAGHVVRVFSRQTSAVCES